VVFPHAGPGRLAVPRFHVTLMFSGDDPTKMDHWVWAGGFLNRVERPTRDELFDIYLEDARAAFTRKGLTGMQPRVVDVVRIHELRDPPLPPPDGRPLRNWRVHVDFVCHDVKFGGSGEGVFQWPEEPSGDVLRQMQIVLMGDTLALRGDGPDFADYSDVIETTVAETSDPPSFP